MTPQENRFRVRPVIRVGTGNAVAVGHTRKMEETTMGLVAKDIRRRWPGNCLVYSLSPLLSQHERDAVDGAMDEWRTRAGIRFVLRTIQD